MEADRKLGCIAPKGIVSIKDNLFFCARDNVYQITPDFRFHPISEPIKDLYQSASNIENSRLFYDVSRDRLICRFGDEKTTYFVYSLISQVWTLMRFTDTDIGGPDFMTIDDSNEVYCVRSFSSSGGSGSTGDGEYEQGDDQDQGSGDNEQGGGGNDNTGGDDNDDTGGDDDNPTGDYIAPGNRDHTSLANAETTPSDYWSIVIPNSTGISLNDYLTDALPDNSEGKFVYAQAQLPDVSYNDPDKNVTEVYAVFKLFQQATVSSYRFANATAPYDGTATRFLPIKSSFNNETDVEETYYWWNKTVNGDPPGDNGQIQNGTSIEATADNDITTLVAIPIDLNLTTRKNFTASSGQPFWGGGERPDSTDDGNNSGGDDSGGNDSGGDDSGGNDSGGGKAPGDEQGTQDPGQNPGDNNSQQ